MAVRAVPKVPTGTLAFLFTDIEGSTRRWESHHELMGEIVARHDALLRREIEIRDGYVFKTVGDAFCAAFPTAPLALAAAVSAQRQLATTDWGDPGPIRVRMAVHVGAAEEREGDYFGQAVNRVARLLSAGHGGQVLLSMAAAQLLHDSMPDGVSLRDMGEHRLKDLARPEHIYQIAADDLPVDFPPLKTLDHRPNNLPPQLTPFMGRDRELAEIVSMLGQPGVRLITLTGPGGTGKTRLSIQVAAELLEQYPDGAWFVALEDATDEALVAAGIAQALGVRESTGQSLQEALLDHLGPKRLMLVLDNFEQVAHAAPFIGRMLGAAPEIAVLVSSRFRLGIQGDHEYKVPPLGLPARDQPLLPVEELEQYAAVQLFVDRARAAKAGFALAAENAEAVVHICHAIDGLPLAIELAAARVRMLPPTALLKRLEERLRLLIGGGADRPARQQTLRATIAWSNDLLQPHQQLAFSRLSVFAGGWTFESAETVVNVDGDLDLFEALEVLVDHSLVRQEEAPDGEPRFHMLATIREFARDQLEALGTEEAERIRSAHATWFLELAEAAKPELTGPDQTTWRERLDTELENLRTALVWLEQTGEAERGLRVASSLWRYWWGRGYLSEGYDWLTRLLGMRDGVEDAVRAAALDAAGVLASDQGSYDEATRLHEEALEIYRRDGDERGTAWVLHNLGAVALHQGEYDAATTRYEESLTLMTAVGDQLGTTRIQNSLGALAFMQGDYSRATERYEESLELGRRLRDEQHVAIALANLAETREYQGDLDRASALYEDALARFRGLGHRWEIGFVLFGLGNIALARRDTALARDLLLECLSLWQSVNDRAALADCLERLAVLDGVTDNQERAARLFGVARALREELGAPRSAALEGGHARAVEAVKAALGEERFDAGLTSGKAMSLDDAISEVRATPVQRIDLSTG